MLAYYIISGVTLFGIFVLFLVVSKSMNSIINQLLKLEYMFQKELEFRKEEKEIKRMIQEKLAERGASLEEDEEEE